MRGITDLCRLLCIAAVACATLSGTSKPAAADFQQRVFNDDQGAHRYSVFLPEAYSANRKWPVILFLHGAGERGTDGRKPTLVGLGPAIRKRQASFPFVAVFPQCEDVDSRYLNGWLANTADAARALQILDEVERDFSIDTDRRVLTGWSMGGYGTWSIAAANPDHWSAIVPLAGGGEADWGTALSKASVWAFHGSEDAAIRPQQSRHMITAIREAGGTPRYTEVTGGGHDIGPIVYDSDALLDWLQNPQTTAPTALALSAPNEFPQNGASEFQPAIELSGAVTVRLGNRMLDALAMSIPEMLPKDLLKGQIADIYDSTVVDGYQFSIVFGGISWAVEPWRIRIQGYQKDRVNIQIGVQNANLRIGGTSVMCSSHSAYAGPIDVVIGHRYPVWLSFDVKPYIENRRLRLKLLGSRFDIPSDNWYVTYPAGVSTRGFGITREKVSNGLVSGLYGNKRRIEREVTSIVPNIVREMEKQLELNQADQLVSSIWPLPVYRPNLRVWPQDITSDERGVSVVLGISAAPFEPDTATTEPVRAAATQTTAAEIEQSEELDVAVAPEMLKYLTQQLIDADVARIHVLDIPENAFADFIDRSQLEQAIPTLRTLPDESQLRTVLHLTKPLDVRNGKVDSKPVFEAPELSLVVSTQTPGQQRWAPAATLKFSVAQPASVQLHRVSHTERALQLQWTEAPKLNVTATDANAKPLEIDAAKLTALFLKCWNKWTRQGPAAQTIIPDIDLGLTQLRLSKAVWKAPFLGVTFSPPALRITNSSDQQLVYETKGPFSGWGGPYTIAPGGFHEFEIAYPLIYRRKVGDEYNMFTLAPGSHSEFRAPREGGQPQLFQAREGLDTEFREKEGTSTKSDETDVKSDATPATVPVTNADQSADSPTEATTAATTDD
ncbi:MAG: carboxylesterase family protein [Planctomycetota bacterium]